MGHSAVALGDAVSGSASLRDVGRPWGPSGRALWRVPVASAWSGSGSGAVGAPV